MPLRALGYVASAARIAQIYLPKAQVQIVHTLHTGERVNGNRASLTKYAAEGYREVGQLLLNEAGIDSSRVAHFIDPEEPLDIDHVAIEAALQEKLQPEVYAKLIAGGTRRGSDVTPYIGAHLQMHDTAAAITPLRPGDAQAITPKRIIGLGAQSERPFYLARMACHQADVPVAGRILQTGQLFTNHVLPPYQFARDCSEPRLYDVLPGCEPYRGSVNVFSGPFQQPVDNRSIARDLHYLRNFIAQEAVIHA